MSRFFRNLRRRWSDNFNPSKPGSGHETFVGQVMQQTQGKANPKIVNELLRKKLAAAGDYLENGARTL